MLICGGNAHLAQDFLGTNFWTTANSMLPCLANRGDTWSLAGVLLVCNTSCANSAIGGTLHFQVLLIDLHVGLCNLCLVTTRLAIDIPERSLLVRVRSNGSFVLLRHNRHSATAVIRPVAIFWQRVELLGSAVAVEGNTAVRRRISRPWLLLSVLFLLHLLLPFFCWLTNQSRIPRSPLRLWRRRPRALLFLNASLRRGIRNHHACIHEKLQAHFGFEVLEGPLRLYHSLLLLCSPLCFLLVARSDVLLVCCRILEHLWGVLLLRPNRVVRRQLWQSGLITHSDGFLVHCLSSPSICCLGTSLCSR
mmetsp:Transcript_9718/g.17473  ORF Transcript_9718/g.17473 Transcript_9718/m.17473 type:complete len:306 (+) Transcript_9718:630-1547(+)